MKNTNQLAIDVEIIRHDGDKYLESLVEYHSIDKKIFAPVFLCYNSKTKQYFVSKITTRQGVENYKSIKIIQ